MSDFLFTYGPLWLLLVAQYCRVLALFELPAGQAKEIIRDDTVIVWKTGDYAAIFNVSGFDCMVNISELLEIQEKEFANDLWTGEKIQTNQKTAISAHGCVLLEIQY